MKIEHILTLSKATMETSSFYYQPASLKVKHYLHLGWHKAHHNMLNNLESFFFLPWKSVNCAIFYHWVILPLVCRNPLFVNSVIHCHDSVYNTETGDEISI